MIILIIYLLQIKSMAYTNQYPNAANKALQAAYNQTGVEDEINKYAKTLDERYVPDYVRRNGAPALIVLDVLIKHRIQWKWTF